MILSSNCHTHTVFCDGKNPPEDMVKAAIEKGFVCLGFSVHSPMYTPADWTVTPERLPAYTAEIRRLQRVYGARIEILHGIELDRNYTSVSPGDFDYVIAAVHQIVKNGNVYDVDYTRDMLCDCAEKEFGGDFLALAAHYYEDFASFVCEVKPQIVAHFDLIEKFNEDQTLFSTDDPAYQTIAKRAVDRILAACPQVLFEVNTGAMFRVGKRAPYPAPFLLRHLHARGVRVIVTADAHCPQALSFAFDAALDACRNVGYTEVYELRECGFVPTKI